MHNKNIVIKMLKVIDRLQGFVSNTDYDTFTANAMLVDACVFNLSQLGEYAGKVDENYRINHSEIPWQNIYSLRNRIVHDYEGVNLDLIWEIITKDIPDLKDKLQCLQ